jgi:hypothetical protein
VDNDGGEGIEGGVALAPQKNSGEKKKNWEKIEIKRVQVMNVFHRAHTVSSRAQRWNILREFHRLQCHVARPCQELELRGACHPNSWLVPFDA